MFYLHIEFVNRLQQNILPFSCDTTGTLSSWHQILVVDIRYNLVELQEIDDKSYDSGMFQAVLNSALSVKKTTHDRANTNIKNIFKQQRLKSRHQSMYAQLNIDGKALLQNQERQKRKGGKFMYEFLGPYTVNCS